jgi:uncharacterized repeat protein (TIGR03803 family)
MNPDGSSFRVLHAFTGSSSDGSFPYAGLTLVGSTLYGTTAGGGSAGVGTVFSMNPDGSNYQVLHAFTGSSSDGEYPDAGLTLVGSTLYGTTAGGGSANDGTVFSMNPDGSNYQVLHAFTGSSSDGEYPEAGLTLVGSTLYGTTERGGSGGGYVGSPGDGTVFSMNPDGSNYQVLHAFTGSSSDGEYPEAGLTLVGSTLYGTTYYGGSAEDGTVFSMNPDGSSVQVLHAFTGSTSDGEYPYAGLTLVGSTLYGTTTYGLSFGDGTVFSLTLLHAPTFTNASTLENTQTTSGLVITPNSADAALVTNFQITGITGGTLFQNDGTTIIHNGDFITAPQGAAGLKFTPTTGSTASGSFTVQESINATTGGLGGTTATATITVNAPTPPVVDLNGSSGTFTVKGVAGSDTPVLIASLATVSDSDSPLLAFVTVTLPAHATGDVLAVSAGGLAGGMTQTYTSANGTLTISGAFSPAQYTTALQYVTYSNTTSLGPGVTSESYQVVANDGSLNSSTVTGTVNIDISVTANLLFYNGSTGYDLPSAGHSWLSNAFSDDNAVATDKVAYLSGAGAATFNSVSSYSQGINGLMIDIAGAHNTIVPGDFILRTGNNNTPSLWTTIPTASITVTTRSGATGSSHLSGTDRIEITMADLLVKNKWLEVIFKGADRGDANTLLATSDVFFFANALGDDGVGETTSFITDPADILGARSNPKGTINNIPITNIYDYDRSRTVDPGDVLIARNNPDGSISAPTALNITGSLAPDTGGGGSAAVAGDSGISSGLADSASANSAPKVPTWLANRLANVDLNSGRIATFFEDLAAKDTPKARKILIAADELADSLGLDDDLLDSLVAGLGQS